MRLTNVIKTLNPLFLIILFLMSTENINAAPQGHRGHGHGYGHGQNQQLDKSAIMNMPKEDISDEEKKGLVYMREEEKLARDVYLALNNKWNMRIFSNISQSEQRHTDAIQILLQKYEITDPVVNDSIGVFTNKTLAGLYTTLTMKGDISLVEALKVGALIEEVDIIDLQKELDDNVDNADIKYVYQNLLNGSYNHLRAFVRNLSRQGITYKPVKLSAEQYNAIIGS